MHLIFVFDKSLFDNWIKTVAQRCSIKKLFFKICQNSQENTYVDLFFIKVAELRPATFLTLSWRAPLYYKNQSIDLQSKSMDWFLYDNDLRHEGLKTFATQVFSCKFCKIYKDTFFLQKTFGRLVLA